MVDPDDTYRMSAMSQAVMQCPDCENAVLRLFKTGKLEHACSTCGTELVHSTSH